MSAATVRPGAPAATATAPRESAPAADEIRDPRAGPQEQDLLVVKDLTKFFPIRRGFLNKVVGYVRAVDHVSFSVREGETLGLVGESGCGKSTTGRTVIRLYDPTDGEVVFDDPDMGKLHL